MRVFYFLEMSSTVKVKCVFVGVAFEGFHRHDDNEAFTLTDVDDLIQEVNVTLVRRY